MAKIDDFLNQSSADRISFYNIKTKEDFDDLKEQLEGINSSQYFQLINEISNSDLEQNEKSKYMKALNDSLDQDLIVKFKDDLLTNATSELASDEQARAELVKSLEEARTIINNQKIFDAIDRDINELKSKLTTEIDKEAEVAIFKDPILKGIEDASIVNDISSKSKIFVLDYNQKQFQAYANDISNIEKGINSLNQDQENLTKENILRLKDSFYSKNESKSVNAFDYLTEDQHAKVNGIFTSLLSSDGKDINKTQNELNELSAVMSESKKSVLDSSEKLSLANIEIKEKIEASGLDVTLDMDMWQQAKDGSWSQNKVDLLKDLDLEDLSKLDKKITEIQKNNSLYLNQTSGNTIDDLRKSFDETFKAQGAQGPGLFQYGVFPYSFFLDLAEAGSNIYGIGKNIANDYKQKQEKSEILNTVEKTLRDFDINKVSNTTSVEEKQLLNKLKQDAEQSGQDLNSVVNNHFQQELSSKLKERGLEGVDVSTEASALTRHLMKLEDIKMVNEMVKDSAEDQRLILEDAIKNLDTLENSSLEMSGSEEEIDLIKYAKSYAKLMNEDSATYEKMIENSKNNINTLEANNNPDNKELIDDLKNNVLLMEDNRGLFNTFKEKEDVLEKKLDSLIKNKEKNEVISNVLNTSPITIEIDSNLAKKQNDLAFSIKNEPLDSSTVEKMQELNTLTQQSMRAAIKSANLAGSLTAPLEKINEQLGENNKASEIDITKNLLNNNSQNPLTKNVSKSISGSLEAYAQSQEDNGLTPSIGGFFAQNDIFGQIDFGNTFKELFEAFLTDYDAIKEAATELKLDHLAIFSNKDSRQIDKIRDSVLKVNDELEKVGYSEEHIPKEISDLMKIIKDPEKMDSLKDKIATAGNDSIDKRLAEIKIIDDKIDDKIKEKRMEKEKEKTKQDLDAKKELEQMKNNNDIER